MEHELRRESVGGGITESTTPTCSCGWRGRPEYAHNDHMYTNLKEQGQSHLLQPNKQLIGKT